MRHPCFGAALLAAGLLLAWPYSGRANNLRIANVKLVNTDRDAQTTDVRFDLSWENSWRSAWVETNTGGYGNQAITNWDAAWVFIKYRQHFGANTNWQHLNLAPSGHAAPAGIDISLGANAGTNVGALVYRAVNGYGALEIPKLRLCWDYGAQGVSLDDPIDISVQAIETVYIPQGPFYAGDGSTGFLYYGTVYYNGRFEDGTSALPFRVTSEDQITLGGGAPGSLGNHNLVNMLSPKEDFDYSTAKILPAAFPKGYSAFYCMKHEITHGQYTAFLNHLTSSQASNLFYSSFANKGGRMTLGRDPAGLYTNASPDRAQHYITTKTGYAYLDWAGLRPMTELEYEKACRGPCYPDPHEAAWGIQEAVNLTSFDGLDGSGTETALPLTANNYNGAPLKPTRAAIFAKSNTTRAQAGAGYYGVLDLSGNLTEMLMAVGRADHRNFRGDHGDGCLAEDGSWNVAFWSNSRSTRAITEAQRHVSDRSRVTWESQNDAFQIGLRGVRTMP